jgi:helicase
MKFDELGLGAELDSYLQAKGYSTLYPPQEAAVRAGLLEGKNLVISSPTASGKTLTAMMAAYLKIKNARRKVVYLAPLRALASEKYSEFAELERFGIRCGISTGDFDSSGESLRALDLLVLTNEKFDSILRHGVSWLDSVGLFVSDEVHLAGNDDRGPTLEMILTKIMHLGIDAQILSLSATISNSSEIASWLKSDLVEIDWRSVPLKEGVYDYGRLVFSDGVERALVQSPYGHAIDTALDSVKEGGQALIFAGTRRRSVSLATKASEVTSRFLDIEEKRRCEEAASKIRSAGEETGLSKLLADLVGRGSAFHHAGLNYEHRKIVEEYYRMRAIKLLSSTPTLCLPEGEEIFGNPIPEQIESLGRGTRVLTHGNEFRPVITPVRRHYSGPLLKITPRGQLPMRMTPEHKVLMVTRTRHSFHSRKVNRHWWTYTVPEWTEAKNLKRGDLVLFPIIKEEKDLERIELPSIGRLANQTGTVGTHWTRLKTNHLELTQQTLEILGLYMAEGYAGRQGQVMFALHTKEEMLTSKVCNWFESLGLRPNIHDEKRNRRVVRACSKQLASKLRELFGESAAAKVFPHSLIFLPNEKLIPLVRGMWLGDGNLSLRRNRTARYDTTSSDLAKQLFAVLVKLGYMPTIKKALRKGKSAGKQVRITHRHDLYTVAISGKQLRRFVESVLLLTYPGFSGNREFNIGYIDSRFYHMPIRKIESEKYSGLVYNLEVTEHSSYVGSFVVHNSAGVNLPARRVVVADITRYDNESGGNAAISVLDYRQMAGRAGRPQYDEYGETVIVPPSSYKASDVLSHYVEGEPEPITSRLAGESAMRTHVLATIATGLGVSRLDVDALFSKTLLASQIGKERVGEHIEEATEYLLREGLVVTKGGLLHATQFGKRVSTLYIDPVTGVLFRRALEKVKAEGDHAVGYLHLIAGSPDFEPKFPLREKYYEDAYKFMDEHRAELILKPDSRSFLEYDEILQDMRTVMVIHAWTNEWKEDTILDRLGVEPGDLHRCVDNSDWLLYCLEELSKLFRRRELIGAIDFLRKRVVNGVKEELVELTRLQGIGRVRARSLFSSGIRTIGQVRDAPLERLSQIEKIGPTTARKIKEQTG